MENFTQAFIKELKENRLLLHVNGKDVEVELTAEEAQQIYLAVDHGTFIVLFDLERQEIVFNLTEAQLLKQFPETQLDEFKDAHITPADWQ